MPVSEAWVDFLAGWASGAVAVWTCQPVDTVLTRLQAGPAVVMVGAGGNTATATTAAATTVAPRIIALQQGKHLIQSFGLTSLWRGSSAMISAVPFQNALLMGGYGIGKQWSIDHQHSSNMTSVFVGGCTGGILQSFFMSPVELLKVNQQVHVTKTARVATRELWRGFFPQRQQHHQKQQQRFKSSSWRGLNATLLRDGIPHGVWFASYEWCKTELTQALVGGSSELAVSVVEGSTTTSSSSSTSNSIAEQIIVPMASGAFAATVAWAVGYPFDIIKTRIQASTAATTAASSSLAAAPAPAPPGILPTALELIRESKGLHGLYRGFGLKLVRAVPASMVGFLTYETVAKAIRGNSSSASSD